LGITVPIPHHLYGPKDGPITEHPQFGQIQWNKSYSHMPQGHWAKAADEPEMMDMDEPATPEPVEPDKVDEVEQEYEETITIRALDLIGLQDSLDDMRFEITNIERDARQAQLKAEERFEAQQSLLREHLHQHSDMSSTLTPCITFLFSISTHCGHCEF
jgi:hypothetical protein